MNNELIQETQKALSVLDPVLWAITSQSKSEQGGLIATFVTEASIVPDCPRFLVGIAKHHQTAKFIKSSQSCALHLFSEEQIDWVWKLGACSGKDVGNKLSTFKTGTWQSNTPILTEAISAFECQVEATFDIGDRHLFLLRVNEASKLRDGTPLTYSVLWEKASWSQRNQLDQLMARDQNTDREAIINWRNL